MEMSTNVVLESGIKPNWLGSIHSSVKGLNSRSKTTPSAAWDNVDVKDMGLRSLLKSSIDTPLGTGGTSASFHIRGTLNSVIDVTPRLKLELVYQHPVWQVVRPPCSRRANIA